MGEVSNLAWVDALALSPVVRRATGRPHAAVASWTSTKIYGGVGKAGLGVFRVGGVGSDRAGSFTWSVVVKAVGPGRGTADDPAAWNYWKREALAFESGAIEHLNGGVVGPRCWGVSQIDGGAVAIWLEDLTDYGAPDWSLADYGSAARHFGRFNAACLGDSGWLDHSWCSRDWMKGRVEECAEPIALLLEHRGNPWIRRMYPQDVLEPILRIWDERLWFYRVMNQLPQTFCHLDAFRRNLFRRGRGHEETVAIDWAGAGIAPLGAEMVPLVIASILFFEFDEERSRELEDTVFAGYLKGLEDGGWNGDPRLVRLGYAASAVLRFAIPGPLQVVPLLHEDRWPDIERSMGRPLGELCDLWARARRSIVLPRADEARALAVDLDLSEHA